MSGKRHSRRPVKNFAERSQYFRISKQFGGEDTEVYYDNPTLEGSDSPYPEQKQPENNKVRNNSLKSWLKLEWKKLIVPTIIGSLILACLYWGINVTVDIRYIKKVLENTKTQIDSIEVKNDDNSTIIVTKEMLDLKLELIEKDFKILIPDTTDIIRRLSSIEEELIQLRNKIGQ